jgi:hypothetical protein
MSDKEQAKEKAVKELEEFKNKVEELLSQYPDIGFNATMYGDVYAYHRKSFSAKVMIDP